MEALTDSMEAAACEAGVSEARQELLHSMERLRDSLAAPGAAAGSADTGKTQYM